jgi:hypothetical protein
MSAPNNQYKRHRFPPEIIQHAVCLYYRFNLSHRDIEDLLAARGIAVSYGSVRLWCNKFGPKYARRLKRRHQGFAETTVPLFESTSVSSAEFNTPKSDGFVADTNASFGEQILDITIA